MMKWPQHFTLNGDTNIDGEVKNMKFEEGKPIISYQVILIQKTNNYTVFFKKFLSKLYLSKAHDAFILFRDKLFFKKNSSVY